jgi:galactokinase
MLVVADTGTRRRLGHTDFNQRFAECREASRLLGVAALRDVPPDDLEERLSILPNPLHRRARHVVREIARTVATADLLERGELAAVGREMNASHAGLRDEYEVSTPELDALAEAAWKLPGVYGSRMSGGGFGGCTISLLAAGALGDFRRLVPSAYREATGREAAVFPVTASAGARVERLTGAVR